MWWIRSSKQWGTRGKLQHRQKYIYTGIASLSENELLKHKKSILCKLTVDVTRKLLVTRKNSTILDS